MIDNPPQTLMATKNVLSIVFMGKPMQFDSNNFCRCCLTDESLSPMTDLDKPNGSTFQALYDSFCPITLQLGGHARICESCVFDLRMAVQFRQMCQQANAKVKEVILTNLRQKKIEEPMENIAQDQVEEDVMCEPVQVKLEPVEQELCVPFYQNHDLIEPAEIKMEEELNIVDCDLSNELAYGEMETELTNTEDIGPPTEIKIEENDTTMLESEDNKVHNVLYVKPRVTVYICELCDAPYRSAKDLKFHLKNEHYKLQLRKTYIKYHREFFPNCIFEGRKTISYKTHLYTEHKTTCKQINQHVIDAAKTVSSAFKCEICNCIIGSKSILRYHLEEKHKALDATETYHNYHRKLFPECSFVTEYIQSYRRHLTIEHKTTSQNMFEYVKELELSQDRQEVKTEQQVKNEKEFNTDAELYISDEATDSLTCPQPDYKCGICNASHKNIIELKCHRTREHRKLLVSSYVQYHQTFFPDCSYMHTKSQFFRFHMLRKHKVDYKKIYEYIAGNKLQGNMLLEDELSPDRTCHHCGKVFKHRSTLKAHFRMEALECKGLRSKGIGILECKECSISFDTEAALLIHRHTIHKKLHYWYFLYDCSKYFPKCAFKSQKRIPFKHHLITEHRISFEDLTCQKLVSSRKYSGKTYQRANVPAKKQDPLLVPENDPLLLPV